MTVADPPQKVENSTFFGTLPNITRKKIKLEVYGYKMTNYIYIYICCTCKLSSGLTGCPSRSNASCKISISCIFGSKFSFVPIPTHSLQASVSVAHSPVTIFSIWETPVPTNTVTRFPSKHLFCHMKTKVFNHLFHEQDRQI